MIRFKKKLIIDVDPFGEENWEDDNLSPVLVIARKQGKPYDQIKILNCSGNQLSNDYKEYLREYCKKRNIKLYI